MLYLVFGLTGSGKTTVSKYLAEKLDAEIINTDVLHGILFPDGERLENGDFTAQQLAEIYRSLRPLAYYLSKANIEKHFIFEGNFRYSAQRDFITEKLDKENIPYKLIYVTLDDDSVAKERIDKRKLEGIPGTYEEYLEIKSVYEKPDLSMVQEIKNSGDLQELYRQLDDLI